MKKIRKNAIVLVVITLIILYFILKDDFNNIVDNLLKINIGWFLIAVICMITYWCMKALSLHIIIKQYAPKFHFKHSLSHILITQFFNGITPFSTGGQPMEIYMLKRHGIRITKGTNIVMQNFIFYQVALVLFGLIAIFLNYHYHMFKEVTFLKQLILLGFIINTLVAVALFIISFGKRFSKFIMTKTIQILSKIHIIKEKEKTIENWDERIEDFHECAKQLRQNKLLMIKGVLYNFLSLCLFYIIPLFIVYSMGDFTSMNPLNTITSSAYVLIIGSFVPIPGASGGIEYGFMTFFGNFIKGSTLSAVLLLWRFLTYYLGIIIGALLLSFEKGDDNKCE